MLAFDCQRVFQSHLLACNGDFFTLCWFFPTRNCRPCGRKGLKNTQLATKTALSTLKAFCGEKYPDKNQDFDEISKEELNELLVDFNPNARKKNGGNYKKTALRSIRFGLQRYFILKRGFNIIADDAFKQSNEIFSSYDQSSPNPKSLEHFVWFYIMYQLIRRGRENLRLHTKQLYAVRVDATGRKYIYQELDELDKNHRQNDDPLDSLGDGRMYENANNPKVCPVRAFELYLSKLHPSLNLL